MCSSDLTSRLSQGMTDVLIACDMIVGSSPTVLKTLHPGRSVAILNTDVAPTGEFQTNRNMRLDTDPMREAIEEMLDSGPLFELPASKWATALTGDSIGTNILMLGYAWQKGLLPVSLGSILQAIRLNGTFVEGNLRTFALGRVAAHSPGALSRETDGATEAPSLATVEDVLASRMRLLTAYQDERYAGAYRDFVNEVRTSVRRRQLTDGDAFVREVALTLARLMAYKDEYEVARLYTEAGFEEKLRREFEGDFSIAYHLAPPLLSLKKDARGRPVKRRFGSGTRTLFAILARLKFLRGTPFDVFGYARERRTERSLIRWYQALIDELCRDLDAADINALAEIAELPMDIRGYGPVKDQAVTAVGARLAALTTKLRRPIATAWPIHETRALA